MTKPTRIAPKAEVAYAEHAMPNVITAAISKKRKSDEK